ncbi:LysR family transcriptional regulator [Achromobacter xylosoxidans]|uniref:LysR family transcriptional regulator n=1 Tax=Alcaligenes xylosoxydans xylosoxydans TaxID=85698 RepID=UPI001F12A2C0|nr:LysR family transcriptional regulator [Achromobacter xylosoxidans]
MRLNRLQALRAVLETGSVTEASHRIHRTQPQISRLISALEDEKSAFRCSCARGAA